MTGSPRRAQIEALLAEDPADAFLRYGLALELEKEGDHARSLDELGALMRGSPPYLPAFFMAAQQLSKLGRADEARGCLREGIELARRQGEAHAAAEMSEFLMGLGGAGES